MTPRLLGPSEAGALLARRIESTWAKRLVAEAHGKLQEGITIRLRPGIGTPGAVAKVGFGAWYKWREGWRAPWEEFTDGATGDHPSIAGVRCVSREVRVQGLPELAPYELCIDSLAAALAVLRVLGDAATSSPIERARRIAGRLQKFDARLTPRTLQASCRLADRDVEVLFGAIEFLRAHDDLSEWTERQLPVTDMHSKWWRQHRALLAELSGRDLERETRPRLAVVHLSYVDPDYLATGARQHDAWTSGDRHALPYQPRVILVVENRDCRLWFPEFPNAIVVEGGGKAAAAHLAQLEWMAAAERVVYWGDIDSNGFTILAHLRKVLRARGVRVESLLMDDRASAAYARLGVSVDRSGRPIPPPHAHLQGLSPSESVCYAHVATSGPAPFRRIEQERIPLSEAVDALRALLAHAASALPSAAIAGQA